MRHFILSVRPLPTLIPLLVAIPLVLLAIWLVFLKPPAYDRWGLPTGAVSIESLRTHPEADLAYPAAVPSASSVSAQVDHTFFESGHYNPVANSTMTLFTQIPPAQVYTWYDRWLRARGWRRVVAPALNTTLLSQWLYDRDTREEYSIAFFKASLRSGHRQFTTRYSILPFR